MSVRVLLIEDEANIAEYLLIGLREEGYLVEHAGDGLTASPRLQAGSWDLVLLDWSLPGLDGLESSGASVNKTAGRPSCS